LQDKLFRQKRLFFFRNDHPLSWTGVLVLRNLGMGLLHWFRVSNIGSGFVKPNISTMVGGLYPQGDIRRDKRFSIFYIGINTGSLLATMVIGFVVVKWGWHAGFGLAGMHAFRSYCIWGQKYLTCW
jgi:dipeptide/tripeptide permease